MKFQSVAEIEVKLSFGDTDLSVGRLASRQNKYFFQFDMIFFTAARKFSIQITIPRTCSSAWRSTRSPAGGCLTCIGRRNMSRTCG